MKELYLEKSLIQIPRLLSLLDRNPYSPTYGSFFRYYWHEKIVDFPNAHFQCSILCLALVYKNELRENKYYKEKNIFEWIIAALNYTKKIQHNDGSFDEFYPNEKGRAVTAIIAYDIISTYTLLKEELTKEEKDDFREVLDKSFHYIKSLPPLEEGVLANHISMIMCFLILYYHEFSENHALKKYEEYKKSLLKNYSNEGWFNEYDGIDPGYLTTTISFIAKFWKYYQDQDLLPYIEQAIKLTSDIICPDGSFGGSMGSRQTVHFYPHGYEIFGAYFPQAHSCADRMLQSLSDGNLVPPEIQSDRYIYYRIEEFLLSYIDYRKREKNLPLLTYQKELYHKLYDEAGLLIKKENKFYTIVNFNKGGVIKVYNEHNPFINDCGVNLVAKNGKAYSSQWMNNVTIDNISEDNLTDISVSGFMTPLPYKYFNPITMSIFKLVMLSVGFNKKMASILKTYIRKKLILKKNRIFNNSIFYKRHIKIENNVLTIHTLLKSKVKISSGQIGGELHIRFVPQSKYFQFNDLKTRGIVMGNSVINQINDSEQWEHFQKIDFI